MKRALWSIPFAVFLAHGAARASTFDEKSGTVTFSSDAVRKVGFESTQELAPLGVKIAQWNTQSFFELKFDAAATEATLSPFVTEDATTALEGKGYLRIGAKSKGLVFFDKDSFAKVKDKRFEVTFWAKAEGIGPSFFVAYGRTEADVYTPDHFPFAQVRALRTGKETSDGWAEFSTGTLDGQVYGVGVQAIGLVPRSVDAGSSFLLDALEIRTVAGAPVAPNECTQKDVDTTCGAEGDCMYGHCVPSSVTWGPLPSEKFRTELAERWANIAQSVIGDRNSIALARGGIAASMLEAAKSAQSSRQFVGRMAELVNLLHDNHTSFGSPSNFTYFNPQLNFPSSSGLGCFGVMDKDLLGGGMAYGVFNASASDRLKPGDVLTAIDGMDPKAWVDAYYFRFSRSSPNDVRSVWGDSANSLAEMLVSRAKTFTVTRCASTTACTGTDRTEVTIDVANLVYQSIVEGKTGSGDSLQCSARFRNAVPNPSGSGNGGEDPVDVVALPEGHLSVQFDGFVGQGNWETSMNDVFKNAPPKVLMDAREGHGGYYSAIDALFKIMRGASEPWGVVSIGRSGYASPDDPFFLKSGGGCLDGNQNDFACYITNFDGFFSVPGSADPPGMASKVAWVNTVDVSANDYMPKLLQGRSKFRIFAPHPTSGAFGSIISLPGYLPGFQGGSIQIQDSKFAPTYAATFPDTVRWESGHGVEPDQVVVQKQSDAMLGQDTLLNVARAWLDTP